MIKFLNNATAASLVAAPCKAHLRTSWMTSSVKAKFALNLFVTHQVRSGRYQEIWDQFVGGEAPELRIPGVFY